MNHMTFLRAWSGNRNNIELLRMDRHRDQLVVDFAIECGDLIRLILNSAELSVIRHCLDRNDEAGAMHVLAMKIEREIPEQKPSNKSYDCEMCEVKHMLSSKRKKAHPRGYEENTHHFNLMGLDRIRDRMMRDYEHATITSSTWDSLAGVYTTQVAPSIRDLSVRPGTYFFNGEGPAT